jgi:uncharacterized protein YjbJ (UPF0337 family)
MIFMDKLEFQGEWNKIKGKIKQAHAHLTENDLKYEEGKDKELLGRLQKNWEKAGTNWLNGSNLYNTFFSKKT